MHYHGKKRTQVGRLPSPYFLSAIVLGTNIFRFLIHRLDQFRRVACESSSTTKATSARLVFRGRSKRSRDKNNQYWHDAGLENVS
ncbi:hypothetical protein CB0940_06090 [Cercospora beticola]|uniref:Uncharacterized protein n=1 Tax=Cercospora beticola TaxID=122368 RepID=A0A2G5HYV1_CERBT|nr:hypothetical protein CB0940_06090 [Cercospora beticola]PIA97681.1 hypothetical protein CB0940_06090 [Cercospora beticola]